MKRANKVPPWLRRMDLVKAELKTVRFPRTAQEGLRRCAELSETMRHLFRESFEPSTPGPARKRSRKSAGYYSLASVPVKRAG
jgi:hypothetical protein